ncbi:putative bifunctional diguanylate cyclase/phosphodiesterase [Nocardioides sp. MH1]|uniref:putative bifunctional diguanylate cyclase/phosphodiesterase n=1 Tax=Nocardioides sp. MH1 TaxID=3242490 RepID=UPI0035229485
MEHMGTGTRADADPLAQQRLLHVVEAAPNAMIMVNDRGRIVLVNSQAERSFGYSRDELLSMEVEQLLPERFRGRHRTFRGDFFQRPDRREMGAGRELYGLRSDGSEVPIEIGLNPIDIGSEHFVLASVIDISERLEVQAAQDEARQGALRRSILDSIPFSVLATDADGVILTANPSAERLLGFSQDALVGARLTDLHADTPLPMDGASSLAAAAGDERERTYRRRDGECVPVNEAITPLTDDTGATTGYLAVAYDITNRREAQAEVVFLATHDGLTRMPNRTKLVQHLREAITDADRDGTEIALLLLDLDHFKRVNDSLGHHTGDELLLRVGERLQRWTMPGELVARFGGDEFVIVVDGLVDAEVLDARVEALLEDLMRPVVVAGHELALTVSIGGAVYPRHGTDPTALLKHADTAMYQAKASGRNAFQWFRPAMLDETNDRMSMASALRHAIGSRELSIAYQPQVDLRTGRVEGFEALARWRSRDYGPVSPDQFIPVAEDSGMIVQLGGWVLRRACRDVASFQEVLGRPLKLAVNVSPRQFRTTSWFGEVVGALNDSGLAASQLELEITEGILMDDRWEVLDLLSELRALGVSIAVDDFGRGYSSLAYLTRFPVDKLKIDRSFIREIDADSHAPIVDAIIVMGHALGVTIVAEGVESRDQEEYLRARDCDEAQGYLYSPGVPAEHAVRTVQAIGVF